jgi:hypothetical protein
MHFDIGDYRMIEWIVGGKKVVGLLVVVLKDRAITKGARK